jgi:hypothetical protein
MQISEDRQPNETRLSRKGSHRIPIIRTNDPQSFKKNGAHKHPFNGPLNNYATKRRRIDEQSTSKSRSYDSNSARRIASNYDGVATSSRHVLSPSHYSEKIPGVQGIRDSVHPIADHRASVIQPHLGSATPRPSSTRAVQSGMHYSVKSEAAPRMPLPIHSERRRVSNQCHLVKRNSLNTYRRLCITLQFPWRPYLILVH